MTARETGVSKVDGLRSLQSLNYCGREPKGTACSLGFSSLTQMKDDYTTKAHYLSYWFRTYFLVPWDFEIAGFDCNTILVYLGEVLPGFVVLSHSTLSVFELPYLHLQSTLNAY